MKTIEVDGKLMMNKSKDDLSDPTDSVLKKGLLDNYIHLLELDKKKRNLLFELICSIIWHKVEGDSFEKKTLIETIKGVDILNNPKKLRDLIYCIVNNKRVRVVDIYHESAIGCIHFRFSKKFTESLKKILCD